MDTMIAPSLPQLCTYSGGRSASSRVSARGANRRIGRLGHPIHAEISARVPLRAAVAEDVFRLVSWGCNGACHYGETKYMAAALSLARGLGLR